MEMKHDEAFAFFDRFYGGQHHFPGKGEIKRFGTGWSMIHCGELATFDSDGLTRLVLMAHEKAIRVSISQAGPDRLKITLHKRKHWADRLCEKHPTLAEVVRRDLLQKEGDKEQIRSFLAREGWKQEVRREENNNHL